MSFFRNFSVAFVFILALVGFQTALATTCTGTSTGAGCAAADNNDATSSTCSNYYGKIVQKNINGTSSTTHKQCKWSNGACGDGGDQCTPQRNKNSIAAPAQS